MNSVVINRNYLNGGGWTVYAGSVTGAGSARSVSITSNVFGPLHTYGTLTDTGPTDVISGNTGL